MKQFFRHEMILLIFSLSAVSCIFVSCNKVLEHYDLLVHKTPDSIYHKKEKVVISYLSWYVDKEHRLLFTHFILPVDHSAEDIIDMYPTGRESVSIPLFNADSTQELYYKVDGNRIDIFKKYQGDPPKPGQYNDFETTWIAYLVFIADNGAFTTLTIVFE